MPPKVILMIKLAFGAMTRSPYSILIQFFTTFPPLCNELMFYFAGPANSQTSLVTTLLLSKRIEPERLYSSH